jgi:hypothetical protein
MAGIDNLKGQHEKMKNGLAAELGAKGGTNKKGSKHLSTHIQELLNDDEFEIFVTDPKVGYKKYEGTPMKAILSVASTRAAGGDPKWADLLFKYGYGTKMEIEHSGGIETGIQDPVKADEFKEFLKGKTKQ